MCLCSPKKLPLDFVEPPVSPDSAEACWEFPKVAIEDDVVKFSPIIEGQGIPDYAKLSSVELFCWTRAAEYWTVRQAS